MDLRARKRWSLLLLLVGLPLYIIIAVSLLSWVEARFGSLPFLAELAVYAVLGILWALPFRRVFTGIGRGDE